MSYTHFEPSHDRRLLAVLGICALGALVSALKPLAANAAQTAPPPPVGAVDAPKVLWHKVPYTASSADAALADGITAFNAGNFDLAIAAFSKALEIRPVFADARYNLGLCFEAVQDHDRAVAEFTKVIEAKPKLVDSYIELGRVYLVKGDLVKARLNADAALKIKPGNKEAAQLAADISVAASTKGN